MYKYTEEDRAIIASARKANKDKRAEHVPLIRKASVTPSSRHKILVKTPVFPVPFISFNIHNKGYNHDVEGDFLLGSEHEKPATRRLQASTKKAPTEKGLPSKWVLLVYCSS